MVADLLSPNLDSRSLPRGCPYPPIATADPVGDILPKGELVPLLDLDPDRSGSECEDEFRVDDRPLDSDLESLEYEYDPVVVDPLCDEHNGERPRDGIVSGADKKLGSESCLEGGKIPAAPSLAIGESNFGVCINGGPNFSIASWIGED